jgi:hypothetical protein
MRQKAGYLVLGAVVWMSAAALAQETEQPAPEPAQPAVEMGVPPEQAIRDSQGASQEALLIRALAPIKISRAQAARLVPLLEQVQAKLKEVDDQENATLARFKALAEQTRAQAVAGKVPQTTTEQQLAASLQLIAQKRQRLRADLILALRSSLSRTLTPEQFALLGESAQVARRLEFTGRMGAAAGFDRRGPDSGAPGNPGGGNPGAGGPGAGGPGRGLGRRGPDNGNAGGGNPGADNPGADGQGFRGRGGGDAGDFAGRMLDRVRETPADQWERTKQETAARIAGAGRGGAASTPEAQQQLASTLALLDRVRAMSPQEYAQSRTTLATQVSTQMRQAFAQGGGQRGGPGAGPGAAPGAGGRGFGQRAPANQAEANSQLDAFLDRYFLSPAAVPVMRRLAGQPGS